MLIYNTVVGYKIVVLHYERKMSTKGYVIMNAVISKKQSSYTIAILFILAMVTAGVLLNDPEVILPEIAAMAIALWAYREPGWLRQPEKIFIAPSITAVIGFMVNQMDIAYLGKVSLTLVFMMLFTCNSINLHHLLRQVYYH